MATASGCRNITESLYTIDEWTKLQPASFKAAFIAGKYYAMHDGAGMTQGRMFMLHTKEADSILEFTELVDAIYANPLDSNLYVAKGNQILQWDADDNNRYLGFYWLKNYQLGQPVNMSVAQVQAKYSETVPVNNVALNANLALMATGHTLGEIGCAEIGAYDIMGSAILPVPVSSPGQVQFTLMRDDAPVYSCPVTSGDAFKLPGDKMSDLYSAQISFNVRVDSVNMAQGMNELRSASV